MFEFFRGTDGKHYYYVNDSDGNMLAMSNGYDHERDARHGAAALVKLLARVAYESQPVQRPIRSNRTPFPNVFDPGLA